MPGPARLMSTWPRGVERRTLAMMGPDTPGASDRPGFFREAGRAGWGVAQGRTEALVGL